MSDDGFEHHYFRPLLPVGPGECDCGEDEDGMWRTVLYCKRHWVEFTPTDQELSRLGTAQ